MRHAFAAVLASTAVLAAAVAIASAAEPANSTVAAPAVAATATSGDTGEFTPTEDPLELGVAGAVPLAGTCEDFGFFGADKKKECDAACKHGKKCVKKEKCGDGSCPDPGYCWKCA